MAFSRAKNEPVFRAKHQHSMTLRIYLRKRPDSRGRCVINFIVQNEWITTGIKVHPDHWDEESCTIKKSAPTYYQLNAQFGLYRSRAEMCIANMLLEGIEFSKKYFEAYVFKSPEDAKNPGFLALIDEYCSQHPLGWQRIKHYQVLKANIQQLLPSPRIKDITYSFALRLQQMLRQEGNNENTISRKLRQLKAVVHHAQKTGVINNDPLINVKIKAISGQKKFLTADELAILEQMFQDGQLRPVHQAVLRYFLFSCYTGLRYSDVIQLKYYDIKNGTVTTVHEKTEKPVTIPLISKAQKLLATETTGLCFHTHSNQVTNRALKEIMKAAGIEKNITYHCSRHTFGTLSIYWGIPKEVVAELMGVDFKTVEVYAKIIDEVKHREMQKWEAVAGTA